MLVPTFALLALVSTVFLGAWVATILRHPERVAIAPEFVLKLTRTAYQRTRTDWQTLAACGAFDRDLLYRPITGSCVFRNAEFTTTMHFDDRGMRITRPPQSVPGMPPRPRLVVLGDSHAMGWGVEDNDTFASVLAGEYGYPTVNLGVSSYATPRELRRLQRDFSLMPDDVIVIQYSDNDFPENRHFVESGASGGYLPADIEALHMHRPTPAKALPVAGLLLRRFWRDFAARVTSLRTTVFGSSHDDDSDRASATTLLRVLERYPVVRGHPMLVVAINGRRNSTHLSIDEQQLRAAGIMLVVPTLTEDDFFAIDDHMQGQGHRTVAAAIANALNDARFMSMAGSVSASDELNDSF